MKSSFFPFLRSGAAWIGAIGVACSLCAQQSPNPGPPLRPSIPAADKLVLLGQVATAAEAKPLIKQYYDEQERLFQERRAAIVGAKGKPPEEQLKAMQAVVAAQRERLRKNRALEARIGAMLKQDREAHLNDKKAASTAGR